MSYATFRTKVLEYAAHAGVSAPTFRHEDGKHIATFANDGVTITGNTQTASLSVSWGSGHRAYART